MASYDLVIFDCDGVLIDSERLASEIESELLGTAGVDISPEEIAENYSGLPFTEILKRIEQDRQVALSASLIDQSEARLDEALATISALPGAREAILGVRGPRCICSNSASARLKISLTSAKLHDLFDPHIFAAQEVGTKKGKPAPDVFLHAAARFKADPRRTFVIEDSIHGVHGAKTAGMRVIGFTGGGHSTLGHADRLIEAGAETAIDKLSDFIPMIEALAGFEMPL